MLQRLQRAGLVAAVRGSRGGYRLLRPLAQISLREVIEASHGPLAVVDCVKHGACPQETHCTIRPQAHGLQGLLDGFLGSLSVQQFAQRTGGGAMISNAELLEELRVVLDPELGINIVDLGLVYRAEAADERVEVDFTLTYPGCPIGPELKGEIEQVLKDVTGIEDVEARLVWEPLWGPERMTEEARLSLGYPI